MPKRSLRLVPGLLLSLVLLSSSVLAFQPAIPKRPSTPGWLRSLERGLPSVPQPLLASPDAVILADLHEAQRLRERGAYRAALVRLLQGYRRGLSRSMAEPELKRLLDQGWEAFAPLHEPGGRLESELAMLEGLMYWRGGTRFGCTQEFRAALKGAPDLGEAAARMAILYSREKDLYTGEPDRPAVMRWARMAVGSHPGYREILWEHIADPVVRERIRIMQVDPVGEAGRDHPVVEELEVEVGTLQQALHDVE